MAIPSPVWNVPGALKRLRGSNMLSGMFKPSILEIVLLWQVGMRPFAPT